MREKKAKKILKDVENTYSNIAKEFSRSRHSAKKDFDKFIPYLNDKKQILDLGCGNGRLLLFLETIKINERPYSFEYIGVDNSKELLTLAKQKHPKQKFILGDQLNIPIEKDKIDIIFNIRAFHHIPSKKLRIKSIQEMSRILSEDGFLIITVWNLWQIKYITPILLAFIRYIFTFGSYDFNDTFIKWGKKHKRYYHAFTKKELIKLFKETNLKIIKSDTINHDHIIIAQKKS